MVTLRNIDFDFIPDSPEKEKFVYNVNNIFEFFQNLILVDKLVGKKFNPFSDFHMYELDDSLNMTYKTVDIYFFIDFLSVYIDYDETTDLTSIIKLFPSVQIDNKRKTLQMKFIDYSNIEILKSIISLSVN